MIWISEHEGPLRGESTVRVVNLRGMHGRVKVEYFPVVKFVGPIYEEVEHDFEGHPVREAMTIDSRPTFRPR